MAKVLKLEDQSESTNPVSLNGQMASCHFDCRAREQNAFAHTQGAAPIAGLPMVEHVVRAAESLSPQQIILVTGPSFRVAQRSDYRDRVALAWQDEPLGTGHAVASAMDALHSDIEWVMVGFR
jgi:dTDP-glucose pyrophosphorylase